MEQEAIHETGLSGNVVASFFPLIIFIYIYIYIYFFFVCVCVAILLITEYPNILLKKSACKGLPGVSNFILCWRLGSAISQVTDILVMVLLILTFMVLFLPFYLINVNSKTIRTFIIAFLV